MMCDRSLIAQLIGETAYRLCASYGLLSLTIGVLGALTLLVRGPSR